MTTFLFSERVRHCLSYVYLLFSLLALAFVVKLYIDLEEYRHVPRGLRRYLVCPRVGGNCSAAAVPPALPDAAAALLRRRLKRLTYEECKILNWKKYGPVERDTTVIVVRVHRDLERLQYLIISLAQVKDIRSAIVIFSHSYYDPIINGLVRSVDFCKVMQLFYPYSVQANPSSFPGVDPSDCTPGASREDHCVERDARLVEPKHHWWWTARHVFETTDWSGSHRGMVVFLEEDVYAAPDMLHMLRYAVRAFAYFPSVSVVSLGRPLAPSRDFDLLTLDAWRPPYDVGLAFNRTAWRRIAALAMHFCMHDDASWSYSLLNLFRRFPGGFADMVACAAPRAVGTAGAEAGAGAGARAARARLARAARAGRLFPGRVRAACVVGGGAPRRRVRRVPRPPRAAGGWADVRDQLFCVDPYMGAAGGASDADDAPTTESPAFDESETT